MGASRRIDLILDDYTATARTTRRLRGRRGLDWALYTAAAGSALALAPAADAAIMYSGVQNITLTRTSPTAVLSTQIDLNGDGVVDFGLQLDGIQGSSGSVAGAFLVGIGGFFLKTGSLNSVRRLASSFNFSSVSAGSFSPNVGTLRSATDAGQSRGQWPSVVTTSGFAGVAFIDTQGHSHLGWIRLAIQNDAAGLPVQLTAVDWAWQTVEGSPIHVGSVPEPSSLALLAAGAAGVAAFRRRRAEK